MDLAGAEQKQVAVIPHKGKDYGLSHWRFRGHNILRPRAFNLYDSGYPGMVHTAAQELPSYLPELSEVDAVLQYLMVRELYALADKAQSNKEKYQGKRRKAPQWYFFWVAAFWMYFR